MDQDENLKLLNSPDYHQSIGIYPMWRIGDKIGNLNEIYPYYSADQCEKILDEVMSVSGWGCEFREVAGMLFCTIQLITGNGILEKSDAGGARESRKKSMGDADKATFEAKTAASGAFVRACARVGIGRHLTALPKVRLKVENFVAHTPQGEPLRTPEELSAYCNKMSPALLHLATAYTMCKATFEANDRIKAMFSEIRETIENAHK